MRSIRLEDGLHLAVEESGDSGGPAVVFANSLGTDMRLWDAVLPHLPAGLRLVRYDKRGHGLSAAPRAPYSMGSLVTDAERLLDTLGVKDCVFVGISIGGLIAQGLATKRLDLVRAVVLSNTATKIGTREMWQDRIDAVMAGGTASLSDSIMERWFSKGFRAKDDVDIWRRMVETTGVDGYAGCCAAIAGTDFHATTAALRLPALVIAGSEDGSTPPDLVRELADTIPGARYQLIHGAGHLPPVEMPEKFAALVSDFLRAVGHLPGTA
ncbi:3-oxoadipate enol-lactonase [Rhodobacterales bacterium HKCCE2091]|nr:3-oxoadipate enol-lactonase [Rhodobacterales bacterium HKCCE2091]